MTKKKKSLLITGSGSGGGSASPIGNPDPPGGIVFGPESVEDDVPFQVKNAAHRFEVRDAWERIKKSIRRTAMKKHDDPIDQAVAVMEIFLGLGEKKSG